MNYHQGISILIVSYLEIFPVMAGPLKGIKVLDLSRILAGPWATQVLADFGAEVIKVERPEVGDDTRQWGPPYLKDQNGEETQDAAYFLAANRGKESITIDFTKEEGRKIVLDLAKQSDVFFENYKVGGLKKYGLDYETLKQINPKLIYCSITGFGQTGPYKDKPGYDAVVQGMGGLMSVTGEKDELPGGGPQKVGVAVADLMTGMYAVSAVTSVLYHREKTGVGQHIDLALLDTQVAWLANQNMNYLIGGEVPKRHGTAHPNIVPYQAVKARDTHFMLAVGNDSQFSRFCGVIERAELALDNRYSTNESRVSNRESLLQIIESTLKKSDATDWMSEFEKAGVPCSPINNVEQVFEDPQVISREMLMTLEHPISGEVKQVANPVKFSSSEIEYRKAPPTLGQDTECLLSGIGYTSDDIKKLREKNII